jgi:hypothetical protein
VALTILTGVGMTEDFANPGADKVKWIWVLFTVHRALTVRQLYNLRLSAPAGFESKLWHTWRAETRVGTRGNKLTCDERTSGHIPVIY